MLLLTAEQVESMTLEQCRSHLKAVTKQYNLNKPITEIWQDVWPILDDIVNTILYLEDHIHKLEVSDTLSKSTTLRWQERKETV
jgi:hypothetical protein